MEEAFEWFVGRVSERIKKPNPWRQHVPWKAGTPELISKMEPQHAADLKLLYEGGEFEQSRSGSTVGGGDRSGPRDRCCRSTRLRTILSRLHY